MQRCNRCGVNIRGNKKVCPLCGGTLSGEPEENVYPALKKKKIRPTVFKVSLFLLLVFLVAIVILRSALDYTPSWMPLALISAGVAFADICVTVYYRANPIKTILWQTYIGMIVCMLVDSFTGWHAWSVIWVLPCAFAGVMISVMAVGSGLKLLLQDFVLYMLFDAVLSLLQIVFIVTGLNSMDIPALLSMGVCAVLFLGALIFRWRDFRSASSRYFNL